MLQSKEDKSLGELFTELAQETRTLVRQEVQLAKVELTQKASTFGKSAVALVVAGTLGFVGFQALVAAAILALGQFMAWWLAALLVGGALAAVAGVLLMRGLAAIKSEGLAPRQTVETLKEDAQWAKEQMR